MVDISSPFRFLDFLTVPPLAGEESETLRFTLHQVVQGFAQGDNVLLGPFF
jgi:hypothetical protein